MKTNFQNSIAEILRALEEIRVEAKEQENIDVASAVVSASGPLWRIASINSNRFSQISREEKSK